MILPSQIVLLNFLGIEEREIWKKLFFFFLLFLEVYRNIRLSLSTSVEYNRKLVREICNERNLIGKNLYEFSEKRFRNVQIYVSKR